MSKRYIIGVVFSIAALWLFFVQVPFAEMFGLLRQMDYWMLLPSVLAYCLSYVFRAVRWQILLQPLGKTSFYDSLSALVIGFMGNNLLPAHLGEFIRAYVLKKKLGYSASATMATIVLERVFDGLAALLLLVLVLMFMPMPDAGPDSFITSEVLRRAGWVGGGVFGGILVILQLFRWKSELSLRLLHRILYPFPDRLSLPLVSMVASFSKGLGVVSIQALMLVALNSLIVWGLVSLYTWFVFPAFGLKLGFYAAMLVQVILVLAMLIPASPGAIGTYHLAAASMLIFLGVQDGVAGSVAMVLWLIHFILSNLAGLLFVWWSGIGLKVFSSRSQASG